MKAVLSIMMLVVGLATFASEAQAQDNTNGSSGQMAQSKESFLPRGGWDGNNLRVSTTQSKLLVSQTKETNVRGGGWDLNNLRISVTKCKLLQAQK
ncbi:MAG: hypothetical protein C0469_17605 [Cyanobacteria bacterium DS2.3.42]|nr:hypothetical protein [Cyanobacteria bacterium DS2.3.42]